MILNHHLIRISKLLSKHILCYLMMECKGDNKLATRTSNISLMDDGDFFPDSQNAISRLSFLVLRTEFWQRKTTVRNGEPLISILRITKCSKPSNWGWWSPATIFWKSQMTKMWFTRFQCQIVTNILPPNSSFFFKNATQNFFCWRIANEHKLVIVAVATRAKSPFYGTWT